MRLNNDYMNDFIGDEGCRITDKGYLKIYREAEECIETIGIAPAAERDIRPAKKLDTEMIKARRRDNARMLRITFSDLLIFSEMNDIDGSMFVPILVPDGKRDVFRRYFIQDDIYCTVHWSVREHHKWYAEDRSGSSRVDVLQCPVVLSPQGQGRRVI